MRSAESRAADIEDRALRQAADVRREADAYAYRVLQKLREQISQVAGRSIAAWRSWRRAARTRAWPTGSEPRTRR